MKRIITGVIICMYICQTTLLAVAFTDVDETDWYYDDLTKLTEEGIIDGFGDGSFRPNETIHVDQFIKTMVVALGYEPASHEGYWAQPYIDKAIELEVIKEGDFTSYGDIITRTQMSILAVRTVEAIEGNLEYRYDLDTNAGLINKITDCGSVSKEEQLYISKSYELGIITGYGDGTFKPEMGLKRSEACTVICRVIDQNQRKPFAIEEAESSIKIQVFEGEENIDFQVVIDVLKPLDEQYEDARKFLVDKIGDKLTAEIMSYVGQKDNYKDALSEDYPEGDPWAFDGSAKLTGKYWAWQGKSIQVISGINNKYITIRAW